MAFTIDAGFLRTELTEGSVGERLDEFTVADFNGLEDQALDELVDRVYDDIDHSIHAALDELVLDAVRTWRKEHHEAGDAAPQDRHEPGQ